MHDYLLQHEQRAVADKINVVVKSSSRHYGYERSRSIECPGTPSTRRAGQALLPLPLPLPVARCRVSIAQDPGVQEI